MFSSILTKDKSDISASKIIIEEEIETISFRRKMLVEQKNYAKILGEKILQHGTQSMIPVAPHAMSNRH